MAFSIRKNEDRQLKEEMNLLDASLMQSLQDRFCDANNVYLACLSKKSGVITKAYGTREELEYLHSRVSMDRHVALMKKLLESNVENVVEEKCDDGRFKLCGVAIRVSGDVAAIWIVIGVMEAEGSSAQTDEIPDFILRTTPERYDKSLEFLETLSKQMFAVKMEELLAQEAFLKSRESEAQMKAELHRNEVMTSVVKMLESENSFDQIVQNILGEVCEYMDIVTGCLLDEDEDGRMVSVRCQYAPMTSVFGDTCELPLEEIPFFNGKPYMISSHSMMPVEFERFFEKYKIKAAMLLPIDVGERAGMYLCFFETERERSWDVNDIKFVSDVKRIIQSILIKRIAENSLASSHASLEAILENVGCGIFVKDPESETILYTNQRFRDSFHKSMKNGSLEKIFLPTQRAGAQSISLSYIQRMKPAGLISMKQISTGWTAGKCCCARFMILRTKSSISRKLKGRRITIS